ncbi:MAG: hypothetical protein HY929_06205 [Euryarchaeota archaeon]|nr:hypothetical protein [Euryarchaeota archaeon]
MVNLFSQFMLHGGTLCNSNFTYEKYKDIKKPVLLSCGRKPNPITQEEVELIMSVRKEHPALRLLRQLLPKGLKHP